MAESEAQLFPLVSSPIFFSNPEISGRPALAFFPVRIEEGEGVLCGFNKGVTRTHRGERGKEEWKEEEEEGRMEQVAEEDRKGKREAC